ncbi:B4GT1 galactosyltransferase, partial [Atractosteus spatula]|nr:B4GT1 galactosyltransferase [Atractosteus spatula]
MFDSSNLNRSFLQKLSKLVVLLCALSFSVSLLFYFRTFDVLRNSVLPSQQLTRNRSAISEPEAIVGSWDFTSTVTSPFGTGSPTATRRLEKCPEIPPRLVGPLRIEFSEPVSSEDIKSQNPELRKGGRYSPKDCIALQKVAIIIPFRKRDEHLKFWLYYLHPILQRQQLDYGVYVINQFGNETFNRAKLLNIGFAESLKDYDYDCFVFSDVDLIPMDDRNIFKCYNQPRHLSVSVDKFGFRLPYAECFGGVSALSKEQFLKMNGFPNNYWGWGGEDDDIYKRVIFHGMSITRPDGIIGKYRMIQHNRDHKNEPNPQRFNKIAHTRESMDTDGINSLTYKTVEIEKNELFTKITVNVGKPA